MSSRTIAANFLKEEIIEYKRCIEFLKLNTLPGYQNEILIFYNLILMNELKICKLRPFYCGGNINFCDTPCISDSIMRMFMIALNKNDWESERRFLFIFPIRETKKKRFF